MDQRRASSTGRLYAEQANRAGRRGTIMTERLDRAPPKISPLYDPRYRAIAYQVALCLVLGFLAYGAIQNMASNLARASIATGFALLEQHRRLRHQPDVDPLCGRGVDLWPRVLGRLAQHAAGGRSRHRVRDDARLPHRHRAAVVQLSRRAACRRLCRADPQYPAAAAASVLVQRRAQGAARASARAWRVPGGGFLNNRGLFLPRPETRRARMRSPWRSLPASPPRSCFWLLRAPR